MLSKKVSMILKSKTDLSPEEIDLLTEKEAWSIIYSIRSKKIEDNRIQVCFTGFNVADKSLLIKLSDEKKLKVVGSVTKKLDFLIAGDNAGPKKIEKAENQGVQILSRKQFLRFIEKGEIPL